MRGILNVDGPLMSFINKVADLLILNLVMLICCIPIVTIGASITSMYYTVLRMRGEESVSVIKDFFHAFRINFKQATIIWLIYLAVIVVLGVEYFYIFVLGLEIVESLKYVVYLITALVLISFTWSFVLLSRYNNRIGRIFFNSYLIGFTEIWKTLMMVCLLVLPFVIPFFWAEATVVVIAVGFSTSAYLQSFFFKPVFEKLERSAAENTAVDDKAE